MISCSSQLQEMRASLSSEEELSQGCSPGSVLSRSDHLDHRQCLGIFLQARRVAETAGRRGGGGAGMWGSASTSSSSSFAGYLAASRSPTASSAYAQNSLASFVS